MDNNSFECITESIIFAQRVKSSILRSVHNFFVNENFIQVNPPILHEQIKDKKQEFYLSQFNNRYSLNSSNALYLSAYAAFFKRVYSISPTFRIEEASLNHLNEFIMIEAESVDINYEQLMSLVENLINQILLDLLNSELANESNIFAKRLSSLMVSFVPERIQYNNFIDFLKNNEHIDLDYRVDLSKIDYLVSKYLCKPTFIIDYPYGTWTAKRCINDNYIYAFYLIVPESYGELCEGCLRTNDAALIARKLNHAKITNLQWYLAALKRIKTEHAGFGIGLERLVRWIVGMNQIQDTVFFPR